MKFVSEINHRAARLKSNLFSADPNQKQETKNAAQTPIASTDLKTQLAVLDNFINSFVHSPMFQNIEIVNSQDSLKAQSDLATVIKISASIKEQAKKLLKGDAKK